MRMYTCCAQAGAGISHSSLPSGHRTTLGKSPLGASISSPVEQRCTLRSFSALTLHDLARLEMTLQRRNTKGSNPQALEELLDFHDNDIYNLTQFW